jgi:hypothetical protein
MCKVVLYVHMRQAETVFYNVEAYDSPVLGIKYIPVHCLVVVCLYA